MNLEFVRIGRGLQVRTKRAEYESEGSLFRGPPMLVDKITSGLMLFNPTNFYQFEEISSYWLVRQISVFSLFFIGQPAIHITVYNRTLTNIENTTRAVHSCNSWFKLFESVSTGEPSKL